MESVSYKTKFTILGSALVPCFGRLALHGTGFEYDLYRYAVPLFVGALAGYFIGLMRDAWIAKNKDFRTANKILKNGISDHKRMEKALQESEEKYRAVVENANEGIAVTQEGMLKYVNQKAVEISDRSIEELMAMPFIELVHPEDQQRVMQYYKNRFKGKEVPEKYELKFITKNGDVKWIENKGVIITWEDKPATLNLLTDITDRKQADETLKKSESLLRSTQKLTKVGGWEWDVEEQTMFWTDEIYRIHDLQRGEFLPVLTENVERSIECYEPEDRPVIMDAFKNCIEKGQSYDLEFPFKTPKGRRIWIRTVAEAIIENHKVVKVIGNVMDISDRIQAEKTLKESEKRLTEAQEIGRIGHFIFDIRKDSWMRSHQLNDIFGIDKNLRKNAASWIQIIHPDHRETMSAYLQKNILIQHQNFDKEYKIINKKTGQEKWVHELGKLKFDKNNNPVELFGTIQDITDQKRLQEKVLKVRELESLGILAGGLAHDFNNLLYVVMGNLSLVEDDLRPETETSENLIEAHEACIKIKKLISQLTTFSQGGNSVKEISSIGDVVNDAVTSSLKGFNVQQKSFIPESIRQVDIDKTQIKLIVRNIVTNAREAMGDNGKLKVSCKNIDITEEGYLTLIQGKYIKISFEDQGCGIPKENLNKIFDPYFSTKPMGIVKGQGLGLAVSYSIIEKHGGLIDIKSELETGSTFSVYLPEAVSAKEPDLQESVKKPETLKSIKQPATDKRKILLMDDERTIRKFMDRMLNKLGYDVKTCTEGNEAVQIYKKAMESKESFDTVVLDLTNKIGMGGQEAMRRLLEIDPNAKGIAITGYSSDPVVSNYRAYGFSGFLTKPATKDELDKVISEVVSKNR